MQGDAADAETLIDWNDPEVAAHPQPRYRQLREQCPVHRAGNGAFIVTHSAVETALRDPSTFSSVGAVELGNLRPLIPLQIDPPEHLKYRKLLDPIFAPRRVARLEPTITQLVNELIDSFVDDGTCDLVPALIEPLPSTVFLTLLGLPLDGLSRFLELKDGIIRPAGTPEQQEATRITTGLEIYQLFERTIAERAAEPRDDLLSHLLAAEVDGESLSHDEILDICFLLLIAGLDTVAAQLSTSFAYLAQHPHRRRMLVENPALVPSAVEELLRWETIVFGVVRRATRDTKLDGQIILEGESVQVVLGAANTDDAEFPDPDVVDFRRNPNRHLAFGGGVHRCLGSHLARLELRVAMREFHRRIPDYELAPSGATYALGGLRAVASLPIVFSPGGHR